MMSIYAIELKDKKDLKKYANKWVALSAKTRELISSAVSAKEALKIALSKGEKDPILTHIPKRFDSYVLYNEVPIS